MEGVRSKDLKSDLEIMLSQHSICVRSQGTAPGSRAALGGATDWVFPVLGVNQNNALAPGGERAVITSA